MPQLRGVRHYPQFNTGLEITERLSTMTSCLVNLLCYTGPQQIASIVEGFVRRGFRRRSSIHQTPGVRTPPASCMVRSQRIYVWANTVHEKHKYITHQCKFLCWRPRLKNERFVQVLYMESRWCNGTFAWQRLSTQNMAFIISLRTTHA